MVLSFLGEILYCILPFPVPASIYGILMLFICLETGLIKLGDVKEVSTFLIEIMPVMFIPAAVGLIESWEIIREDVVIYVVITVVTTLVVMVVAGRITQRIIRGGKKKENEVKAHE